MRLPSIIYYNVESGIEEGFFVSKQMRFAEIYHFLPSTQSIRRYIHISWRVHTATRKITWSMSHMTTLSTVLCLSISLAVDPSPPPIIKMCLGLTEKKYKPCYIVIAEPASRFMFAKGWSRESGTSGGAGGLDEPGIHGKWTRPFQHSAAFHQELEPAVGRQGRERTSGGQELRDVLLLAI